MDNNNNTKYTPKITNHNSCTTDSNVFGTIKLCKFNNHSDSDSNSNSNYISISNSNSNSNICLANFCISCGENLGEHNPRQYCNKIYCPYEN